MKPRRFWLCVPPALFAIFDFLMTARGQPRAYWEGDFARADEANPVVFWLMTIHPAAIYGFTFLYIVVFCLAILKTPRLPARMLSLTITFSHAFCVGTWLFKETHGYYLALCACIVAALLWVGALELAREEPA